MARNVPFVMTTFLTMDAMKTRRLQQKLLNGSGDGDNQLSVGESVLLGVTSALGSRNGHKPSGRYQNKNDDTTRIIPDPIRLRLGLHHEHCHQGRAAQIVQRIEATQHLYVIFIGDHICAQ
jgi:hypothetical protein